MANKLEQELNSLEKTINKLQGLIPNKKDFASQKVYGKAYRRADAAFYNNLEVYRDSKWIRGLASENIIKGTKVSKGKGIRSKLLSITGTPDLKDYRPGLGETLEALLQKRKEIRELLKTEKIDSKTAIPPELRNLFPAGSVTFGGDYQNPYWDARYEDDTILKARNTAKKDFYDQYGRSARKMSSKEKLAIMSKNFSPQDEAYTGDLSVKGHLGIRTSKTNFKEGDRDSIAVKTTQQNKYNPKSTQRPNRSELMSLTGAEWEAATANSPAAQSGVWEPGERWKIQKSHRDWLKANNRL